jgi:hypothetical protein
MVIEVLAEYRVKELLRRHGIKLSQVTARDINNSKPARCPPLGVHSKPMSALPGRLMMTPERRRPVASGHCHRAETDIWASKDSGTPSEAGMEARLRIG